MRGCCKECPWEKPEKHHGFVSYVQDIDNIPLNLSDKFYIKPLQEHTCHMIETDSWNKDKINKNNYCIGRKNYLDEKRK